MKKSNKKKNIIKILMFLFLILLFAIEILKNKVLNIDFNIIRLIIKYLIIISLYGFSLWKFKEKKWLINLITLFIFLMVPISCIFVSLNINSFLALFLFLITITLVSVIKFNKKFEVAIIISVSLLILFFILIALLNILHLSLYIMIGISLASIIYIQKNKKQPIVEILEENKKILIIFTILYIIAILGGIGRYVHLYDEYSYWAYAAKVMITENSLYSVLNYLGATKGYPPVSNLWYYIINIFTGYKEAYLYIGLSLLNFIYMLPIFGKIIKKNNYMIALFVTAIAFSPLLFNGSIAYDLLYVDLLLGILCGTTLIIQKESKDSKRLSLPVILLLIIITLLKVNGFVFSCSILFLFYLIDLFNNKITIKNIFVKVKKYILPVILVLLLFLGWKIFSSIEFVESPVYITKIIPEVLRTDLASKLNYTFILNFLNSLVISIDETTIFTFIEIPLFTYLIIILISIYYLTKNKTNNFFQILTPYIIAYLVFFTITALSLFVMFTQYEASILASFGRYLAPINIALLFYVLYLLSKTPKEKTLNISCLILICLIGFSNITFFITDLKDRRETMHISEARQELFSIVNENTKEDDRIFVINQSDEEGIMPLWYARYYCYPRIVNSHPTAITWKILTPSNEWDLKGWGLTPETFVKHLIEEKFEYVFFYSTSDELIEELEHLVVDEKDLEKNKLFKINVIDNNNIKLETVK